MSTSAIDTLINDERFTGTENNGIYRFVYEAPDNRSTRVTVYAVTTHDICKYGVTVVLSNPANQERIDTQEFDGDIQAGVEHAIRLVDMAQRLSALDQDARFTRTDVTDGVAFKYTTGDQVIKLIAAFGKPNGKVNSVVILGTTSGAVDTSSDFTSHSEAVAHTLQLADMADRITDAVTVAR